MAALSFHRCLSKYGYDLDNQYISIIVIKIVNFFSNYLLTKTLNSFLVFQKYVLGDNKTIHRFSVFISNR